MPFSQETLNEIFKISTSKPDRVISRESGWLEFKESFGWASLPKYLKTLAAFANTKGGYLVFGIANRPHILKGLSGSNLKAFEDIDPERLTKVMNEHFAPEIQWEIHEYDLQGKIYGLLYVPEAKEKPVVCTKDAGKELKESDIYYRYRGRSERIKYPELRDILDQKREREQQIWMRHLSQISRIGVQDVGIFDLKSGQVTGKSNSLFIDESLLSQLAFIKEGEFSEVKGKPTLKLIGNVEKIAEIPVVGTSKQIVKTKGIRIGDIVLSFLNAGRIDEPLEHVKQICFETTAFLPVYYFVNTAKVSVADTIKVLEEVVSRSPAKAKLIERLSANRTQYLPLPKTASTVAEKKQAYIEAWKSKSIDVGLEGKELEYCLQALRGISAKEIKKNSSYIRKMLREWFNKHYAAGDGSLVDNLRRAICWVDEALNMKDKG